MSTVPKEAGPAGCLYHWSSRKLVQASGGGSLLPSGVKENTDLVLHDDSGDSIHRLENQFRFLPVEGARHCGYIEHITSRKIVHPKDDSLTPGNGGTHLVLRSANSGNAAALFWFRTIDEGFRTTDEEDCRHMTILVLHKSGMMWYPQGGRPTPANGTPLVLQSDQNDVAKFYFHDLDGKPIKSPYPKPYLSGDWKMIRGWVTPKSDHTYTVAYKIGRSKMDSEETQFAWDVSAQVAKGFFTADAKFSGFVEHLSSQTWSEEIEVTTTNTVKKGQPTVFVWQYVFKMAQYGEELEFQSTIIGDTDSESKKPDAVLK